MPRSPRRKRHQLVLSGEQGDALPPCDRAPDLGVVIGTAGAGKSAMLGVAREAWEAAGYTVRGAALSGIAAENLESGSGIASRTLASMEHGWKQGRDLLTGKDVLVIDEAGMVGTRQLNASSLMPPRRGQAGTGRRSPAVAGHRGGRGFPRDP
jgi:ATP-dependent exoDNAse (exonuclease V) alpha subunit